ncbi:hypothetical protein EON63_11275 [archaeon]|nr:MAG: hypothetical protein EON63_11275 [archaeon]
MHCCAGLTVDLSASGTTVCPVIDGYAESRSIQRSALGTRALDAFMLQLLVRKRYGMGMVISMVIVMCMGMVVGMLMRLDM